MGEKVTIYKRQAGRQINAYCSVLCQVPYTCRSMPHRQVHRLIRCAYLRCDLLPKRNELHANDGCIQQIFGKGRHLPCVPIPHLGRLSHIDYQSRCQLSSRAGSNRQHLLSQAFPFGCLSYLLCHNLRCVSHLHLSAQYRQNPQREVLTNYHNYHLYSKCNACQYCSNRHQLCFYESTHTHICNYQTQFFEIYYTSNFESKHLCMTRIFHLHTVPNFLLASKIYETYMPTCFLRNNSKFLIMPLGKQGKFRQFYCGSNHQTLLLLEFQKVNLMAFRHIHEIRQTMLKFATTSVVDQKRFSNYARLVRYKVAQPRHILGKSSIVFPGKNSKIQQKLVSQSFYNSFLFLNFSFSYNPCIILIINRVENKLTYGFEASDFAEVPLTQNRQNLLREEWNSALINLLGIDPVNRTLSNILELGCVGLSWNITLSTAPTKFRSLHLASPMLRQEADGGIGLLFLLNVRQNKNTPAIRTGMGLQGHIYVVPKPSYLFNAIASLTLNQKALQIYNEKLNGARSVKIVLTFNSLLNMPYCRNIAKIHKRLVYNYLCINFLHVLGCLFPVLKVMGLNPIGVTSGKLVDNQYFTTFLFFIIEYIPP